MKLPRDVIRLRQRDGDACWLCGCPVDFSISDRKNPKVWSRDHVIPRSWGGSDLLENLRLAHQGCNESRGCKSPRGVRRIPRSDISWDDRMSARQPAGGRVLYLGEEPLLPCA